MKRKLTLQQRAERYAKKECDGNTYIYDEPPEQGYPFVTAIAWKDGYKAGQREGRARVIDAYREHYAAAQRLLAQLTDENAELRAKVGGRLTSLQQSAIRVRVLNRSMGRSLPQPLHRAEYPELRGMPHSPS